MEKKKKKHAPIQVVGGRESVTTGCTHFGRVLPVTVAYSSRDSEDITQTG